MSDSGAGRLATLQQACSPAMAGAFKDDPDLDNIIVEEAIREVALPR